MALSCDPKLLIADEPTTALDVTIQAQILELIKRIQDDTGAALMLITHDLGVVAETVRDVVVMYAGRIIERGTVNEVLLSPKHPYTEGLIRSIPSRGLKGQRLNVIKGTVPNPFHMPAGCNFGPRCGYRFEPCEQYDPRIEEADPPDVACWLWTDSPGSRAPKRGLTRATDALVGSGTAAGAATATPAPPEAPQRGPR
jgi:oligopeptide/dipeptide ABC transporter ATP-binding protein